MRKHFAAIFAAASLCASIASSSTAGDSLASVGVNGGDNYYWSGQWMFADLVKHGMDWGEPEEIGTTYTLDENGWVNWLATGAVRNLLLVDGNYPTGRYVILYEGEGSMFANCADCNEISRAPGRIVVDILSPDYLQLTITSVNASNYPRNIRLVPIEQEATYLTQPFDPTFLERLRPFAAFRLLNLMATNGNTQVTWSERPKPTDALQGTEKGVALEYLVELANQADVDPWFCIPPRVDDDYIHHFAQTVWTQLEPERKVYVEYGNEIWNDGYPYSVDGDWMASQALLEMPPLYEDDGVTPATVMTRKLRYQVWRSRQIFEIFQQEAAALGVDARRLVRVLASQSAYIARITYTLDWQFPDGSFAYQHADALAVAPYFAGPGSDEQSNWLYAANVDGILDFAECAIDDSSPPPSGCGMPHESVLSWVQGDKAVADARGLRLLGYEGGQHLVAYGTLGEDADFVARLADANRHPRMRTLYEKYLTMWKNEGGELLCLYHFAGGWGRWGYWGLMEHQGDPLAVAPKYEGALDFMSANPLWWQDPWPVDEPSLSVTDATVAEGSGSGALLTFTVSVSP